MGSLKESIDMNMDKPKKVTGWSCSLYWNGHDFLATVQCETKEEAVEVFEELFSRRINPDEVKETVTSPMPDKGTFEREAIETHFEEYRLGEKGWA